MGQKELRRSLQKKYRTGEQSSQRPFYRKMKPFCCRSQGNIVRNCGRTAMVNYSAQCRTWCGAMPNHRGQYWTHRCSPLRTQMILRIVNENCSTQCRTWCGTMPNHRGQYWTHRCSPLRTQMILRTVNENCSTQCRTWCGTMPHRCSPIYTIDFAVLMMLLWVCSNH